MEKVMGTRDGRFTLKGLGEKMADGRFQATYMVIEHADGTDKEIKVATGQLFASRIGAADVALDFAREWLEAHEAGR